MFKPKYNSVFSSSGDILTKHKEKRNNIFPKKNLGKNLPKK